MEGALEPFVEWVRRNPGGTLAIAAGAFLLLAALLLVVLVRLSQMARRQSRLLRGTDGVSLERMLMEHGAYKETVERQIGQALQTGDVNAATIQHCFQRVGMVRYDAFPDVGGEQSFSAALLDAQGNGLVLSGLHSRQDVRIYAKPIAGGVSSASLTDEERQAIAGAAAGGPSLLRSEKSARTASRR